MDRVAAGGRWKSSKRAWAWAWAWAWEWEWGWGCLSNKPNTTHRGRCIHQVGLRRLVHTPAPCKRMRRCKRLRGTLCRADGDSRIALVVLAVFTSNVRHSTPTSSCTSTLGHSKAKTTEVKFEVGGGNYKIFLGKVYMCQTTYFCYYYTRTCFWAGCTHCGCKHQYCKRVSSAGEIYADESIRWMPLLLYHTLLYCTVLLWWR